MNNEIVVFDPIMTTKERKRIANKKHREKIENDIHIALTATGQLDNVAATGILDLIKNNKIPHVTINY
ncbi:hypothetical protein LCGC14_1594400 [marine sediment metagenome]|uniref:Uncharacterized protein n=1 Tax=marine sediment metagenome TaxID=412755 RepID=A0A0F9IZD5_9ZZZZ